VMEFHEQSAIIASSDLHELTGASTRQLAAMLPAAPHTMQIQCLQTMLPDDQAELLNLVPNQYKSAIEQAIKSSHVIAEQEKPLPTRQDRQFEVESVVNERMHDGKHQFLVDWKGHTSDQRTWEEASSLAQATESVQAFQDNGWKHDSLPARSTGTSVQCIDQLPDVNFDDYIVREELTRLSSARTSAKGEELSKIPLMPAVGVAMLRHGVWYRFDGDDGYKPWVQALKDSGLAVIAKGALLSVLHNSNGSHVVFRVRILTSWQHDNARLGQVVLEIVPGVKPSMAAVVLCRTLCGTHDCIGVLSWINMTESSSNWFQEATKIVSCRVFSGMETDASEESERAHQSLLDVGSRDDNPGPIVAVDYARNTLHKTWIVNGLHLKLGADIEINTECGVWLGRLVAIIDSPTAGGCHCVVRYWYKACNVSIAHRAEMGAMPNGIRNDEVFRSEPLEYFEVACVTQVLPTPITHAKSVDARKSPYTFERQYNPNSTSVAFTDYPLCAKAPSGKELSPIRPSSSMLARAKSMLKAHFGYTAFREHQFECCTRLLEKQDAMLVLATGGGKSICYWLPTLMQDGVCVVICPLKSLMTDQVASLKRHNICAKKVVPGVPTANDSEDGAISLQLAFDCTKTPKHKLVYMTPEMAMKGMQVMSEFHKRHGISLLAVDEAHCISEWGNDFRNSYRELGRLREVLPGAPCVALTATANARVQSDIIESLGLCLNSGDNLFKGSFNRANLKLNAMVVRQLSDSVAIVGSKITAGCSIVYCITCQEVETMCEQLREHLNEVVAKYHGKMEEADKKSAHQAWGSGVARVIVATNAFGMGIDKPDVRHVVHVGLSGSLSSYFQEIGRAGRDGRDADATLIFTEADANRIRRIKTQQAQISEEQSRIIQSQISEMLQYARTSDCKRYMLLDHFGKNPSTHQSSHQLTRALLAHSNRPLQVKCCIKGQQSRWIVETVLVVTH
jgi:RecQ family ATP-dependent DNA helicase